MRGNANYRYAHSSRKRNQYAKDEYVLSRGDKDGRMRLINPNAGNGNDITIHGYANAISDSNSHEDCYSIDLNANPDLDWHIDSNGYLHVHLHTRGDGERDADPASEQHAKPVLSSVRWPNRKPDTDPAG